MSLEKDKEQKLRKKQECKISFVGHRNINAELPFVLEKMLMGKILTTGGGGS